MERGQEGSPQTDKASSLLSTVSWSLRHSPIYAPEKRKLYVKSNYFAHNKPLCKDAAGDSNKYLLSHNNMLGTVLDLGESPEIFNHVV